MADPYVPPNYPLLRFIAAHGMKVAALTALLVLLGGLSVALGLNSWLAGAAAIVAALLLGGILASYVEMVRVVIDTLVPR